MQLKKALIISLLFLFNSKLLTQSNTVFQHLNTTNGLSYIGVNGTCVDKNGNLWIATGNGLNMFNGKTVEKYFATEIPELQSSNIVQITCDSNNRVWILTAGGFATLLDEKRKFHRVAIYENQKLVKVNSILYTANYGIVLYCGNGNYHLNPDALPGKQDSLTNKIFRFLPLKGYRRELVKGYGRTVGFDEEYYLLVFEDIFFKVAYKDNTVERYYLYPHLVSLIKWGTNEWLACDKKTFEVKAINLVTGEISYPFKDLKDQFDRPINCILNAAARISTNEYLFTTQNAGIYIYNTISGKINNYRHNISDPSSLSNDNQNIVTKGKDGWIFIVCNPKGISYFNRNDIISNQTVFTDGRGNGYDGLIAGITTKDNNTYYFGTVSGMMEWKRNTNTATFINLTGKQPNPVYGNQQASSIVIDKYDKIWAATVDNGIVVMNKSLQQIRTIKSEEANKKSLKVKKVNRLLIGPDEFIWVCGRNGISRINPVNYEIENFENSPLKRLDSFPVVPLYFSDSNNLWIATAFDGMYHYNLATKTLEEVASYKPYWREGIYDLGSDNAGNIYVAGRKGLKILYPGGRVKLITPKEGLLIDGGESILRDKHGRMWIGNDIGVVCYNPADSSLRSFDVRYGLSIYGFLIGFYFQMPNGEFFFGTPKGVQYFHPDSLYNKKVSLNVSVNKIETKRITSNITGSEIFHLVAADNKVTFYFGTVDFSPHIRTYYEYKLVDLDKEWIKLADQNSVRYNSLPPGKYIFKVRISNDNRNWQESDNEVTIIIAAPFYQTWWFKTAGILLGLLLIWYVLKYYQKKQVKQREELETELVINYFASQINRHQKTDDLLWDVAKNCISRLNFEDCVIYLKDEEKNILIQKAAYGPKSPVDFSIHQPIEIPVGKGIVGTVAATGKALLVSDTQADTRYIVDDARRNSELAVPMIVDGKVIGVIDSEHHRKNFFTPKHLQILSTIAVLCVNQIRRTQAEEEKQKARIEALQNKQKAVETRLQSLRLQMNPHFLFNALNSIQQMILANEEMVATRYLSRFSKLLRTILVHSDKETVTLKEEVEILKLYVELESIRFKDAFHYEITCDNEIDAEEVKIPTLLIQPFVENAIWHGLMHKEGQRNLKIEFIDKDEFIHCIIEDNGIGRIRAKEMKLKTGQDIKHTSKGIQVSEERLKAIQCNGVEGSINIIDLSDAEGNASGTRVEIIFPTKNN